MPRKMTGIAATPSHWDNKSLRACLSPSSFWTAFSIFTHTLLFLLLGFRGRVFFKECILKLPFIELQYIKCFLGVCNGCPSPASDDRSSDMLAAESAVHPGLFITPDPVLSAVLAIMRFEPDAFPFQTVRFFAVILMTQWA